MSDSKSNTLYLLSGLPRSGKSTWARKKMKAEGWPIVSGDAMRRVIYHRRFWLPGEPLVHAHLRTMVKALFIAGHRDVILDEAILDKSHLDLWRCYSTGATEQAGGDEYRALLSVDLDGRVTDDDLQGDVIAWRRSLVVIPTPAHECLRRTKDLAGYNQRKSLREHIERCDGIRKRFTKRDLAPHETLTIVSDVEGF